MTTLTENICPVCDKTIHALVDTEDFYEFKVGRVRCSCGSIVMPCNECPVDHIKSCPTCPYKDAQIVDTMTDEDYVSWNKENDKETYDLMLKGEFGETYKEIANRGN